MIKYYLRLDNAHIRIDEENKVVTNILILGTHKFIGYNTDTAYVDSMIDMANNNVLTLSNETDFNAALNEVQNFINNLK
jgi:ribonuclease BN (tRNA processing enzyme)